MTTEICYIKVPFEVSTERFGFNLSECGKVHLVRCMYCVETTDLRTLTLEYEVLRFMMLLMKYMYLDNS